MPLPSKTFLKRAAERVIWTAVEAGAAWLASSVGLFPAEYIPVVTVFAAFLKQVAAQHIGDPNDPAIGAP